MLLSALSILYFICAMLLAVYAAGMVVLLFMYWLHQRRVPPPPPGVKSWPTVAVQLPVYNERHVVERLLDAVARLDYPHDRLVIQVLDDSTDDTSKLIAKIVKRLKWRGLNVQYIHRLDRAGYKAGALAYGLEQANTEFVVVFDADFLPQRDFLIKTIPHLVAEPRLGMVQARWGHLNTFDNALTMGQTLALDGHFVVEQTARSRAGWLLNFSGSGGVWRTACIREAGGWSANTLTEDLDLSYRAQLAGWRFLYVPDVVVPAQLPPQMAAYKRQQARWAQGSTQTLVTMLRPLWRARLTLIQKFMALLHLGQYLPHPLMLMLVLLTPPLILTRGLHNMPLGPLGLVGLAPPLILVISQRALYRDWPHRMMVFPVLMALGIGMTWNNTRAVVKGLIGGKVVEFERTPKFAADWSGSGYALRTDRGVFVEIALAVYAFGGVLVALRYYPPLALYLITCAMGYGMVAAWTLHDTWLIAHHPPQHRKA